MPFFGGPGFCSWHYTLPKAVSYPTLALVLLILSAITSADQAARKRQKRVRILYPYVRMAHRGHLAAAGHIAYRHPFIIVDINDYSARRIEAFIPQ
jgi:hypothetical protein